VRGALHYRDARRGDDARLGDARRGRPRKANTVQRGATWRWGHPTDFGAPHFKVRVMSWLTVIAIAVSAGIDPLPGPRHPGTALTTRTDLA
jgi:hypothetical protein